jgi:hypothetical protein
MIESACAHCEDVEGDPLCSSCRSAVLAALRAAPALYVKASMRLSARGSALSERVSSSRPASRSPLRDDLLELADLLARELSYWSAITFGHRFGAARQGFTVQHAAADLAENLPAALNTWRGQGAAARVVRRVAGLRRAIGETALVHQLAAPCPQCDTRALIRRDGADSVECRLCGASWPESRYELLVRALVANNEPADQRLRSVAKFDAIGNE